MTSKYMTTAKGSSGREHMVCCIECLNAGQGLQLEHVVVLFYCSSDWHV